MAEDFSIPWGAVFSATPDGQKDTTVRSGPAFGRSTSPWKLYSLFTSNTRLWAASSARFVVVRPLLGAIDGVFGQSIDVKQEFIDMNLPLPEDPIIIEGGYATTLYSDDEKHLVNPGRLFFGYVETVNVVITMKGIKVTMSCRDPLRFLLDNKFSGAIFAQGLKIVGQTGFDELRKGSEKPLVFGDVDDALGVTGTAEAMAGSGSSLERHKVISWLIYAGSNGGCLPGVLIANGADIPTDKAAIEASIRLIAPTTDLDGYTSGCNIMDKSPMEVIKHLGSLEAEPRELYADINNGRVSWVRRATRNLDNPVEYCAVIPFPQGSANAGQRPNVLSSSIDWSTIGTISELIVVNPTADTNNADKGLNDSGVLNISGRLPDDRFFPELIPQAFDGIRHFTRRTRYIFDDTMNPADPRGGLALINAMFRIWGKDIKAGTIEVQGDALRNPGEAIKCWNLGLFSGGLFRIEALEHTLIAQGPKRGFRTHVAFAETDEDKAQILNSLSSPDGLTGPMANELYKRGSALGGSLTVTGLNSSGGINP